MFADTWGIPRGKRLSAPHFCSAAKGDGFAIANVAFTWDMHGVHLPDRVRQRRDRLPGHARRAGHLDAARGPLEGGDRVLHLRHDRPGDRRSRSRSTAGDPAPAVERVRARTTSRSPRPRSSSTSASPTGSRCTPAPTATRCRRAPRSSRSSREIKRVLEDSGIHGRGAGTSSTGRRRSRSTSAMESPIDVVDATIVLKYVVKQIARRHGLRATFMPKPYITEAGNGLHIHQSLLGADGRNAFAEEDDDSPLRSKLMRRYLSGLLAHQVELQAVNCPTINAYKRVEDYSFAPTQVSWGLDNRLVGVRSTVGPGRRHQARVPLGVGRRQPLPRRRRLPGRRSRRARARARGAADGHRRPARRRVAHPPAHAAGGGAADLLERSQLRPRRSTATCWSTSTS